MDDVKLFKLHAMGKERKVVDPRTQKSVSRMTYETSLTLNVPKGDRTLKALLINMQQTTDFAKRVNKQLLKLHNHFFRVENVEDVFQVCNYQHRADRQVEDCVANFDLMEFDDDCDVQHV